MQAAPSRSPRIWQAIVAFSLGLTACGFDEATPPPGAGVGALQGGVPARPAAHSNEDLPPCEGAPIGVETTDYWLHFHLPAGLMPDPQFDGRGAKIEVHRVRPVYAQKKCASRFVAVLIHGRTVAGPPVFDLRHGPDRGGALSVQEALAREGIDTFAPSLLGYGRSTGFEEGLDDPCNASLPAFNADGTCASEAGCDRTHNAQIFPLNLQGPPLQPTSATLWTNPLGGVRCPHSSKIRFGRTDLWVRDIDQVIEDAVERAGLPADGQVTLVGYSFGAQRVGRALYPANPVVPAETARVIARVNKVVFIAPLFLGPNGTQQPTEETAPPGGFVTFPLNAYGDSGSPVWGMPPGRSDACTGHTVAGSTREYWEQIQELDPLGRTWGGSDPEHPSGLGRSPTFSTYGFNATVAGALTTPSVLVIQGLEDAGLPPPAPGQPAHLHACALFRALPATLSNKVLVEIQCASHLLHVEGCSGDRCTPPEGAVPYGGSAPWGGPNTTVDAALIEWIKHGTFDGAASGRFYIDAGGVAHVGLPATCP